MHRNFDLSIFGLENQPYFYPPTVYKNPGAGDASDLDLACAAVLASDETYCGIKGHFQCEECFLGVADEVREKFTLPPLRVAPEGTTQVAVQVRRGDYVKQPIYAVCGVQYFLNAMTQAADEITNIHFVFVSDDMDWCHQTFGGLDAVTIGEPQTMEESLQLMLGSEAHIISNSTFGFFGAWLNEKGPVFVPERWMNGPWKGHHFDIAPQRWTRIPV